MSSLPEKSAPPQGVSATIPLAPPRHRHFRRWAVLVVVVGVLGGAAWFVGRSVWASSEQQAAQRALEQYDFEEALEHLENCLRVWPSSATIRSQAARTARRAGLLDRAEEHLLVCEKKGITPDTALEQSLLLAQRGELLEVETMLHRLIQEDHPDVVLIIEALAQGYRQTRRMAETGSALEELIRRAPEHPWAYFWRGDIYEQIGRIPLAVPDYRRAVELLPHRARFRLRLVQSLLRFQKPAEAWPHIEELLRQSPADPEAILCAARCQRSLGRPEQALEYLERLLHEQPQHSEAWEERGLACSDQGDAAAALDSLQRAHALDPGKYTIGFSLFQELRRQGKVQEAARVLQECEAGKREEEKLTALYNQASAPGTKADVPYEIGVILMRRKATTAALSWFSEALRKDADHRPTHEALADYHQRMGNSEAAAYHRARSGKRTP
jgi:tetratricopeptide (TPR) repeat protein